MRHTKADLNFLATAAVVTLATAVWLFAVSLAPAQQIASPVDIPCQNDEPCKVIVLSQSEIDIMIGQGGILATAAQARNLDLGQYVSFFRQKIALSPAGKNAPKPDEKKPAEAPKQPEAAKK